MKHRNNILFQFVKETVERFHIETFFIGIQHHIIQLLSVFCAVRSKFLLVAYDVLKHRSKFFKVLLFFRLCPYSGRLGGQLGKFPVFPGRNTLKLFNFFGCLPDNRLLCLCKPLLIPAGVNQLLHFFRYHNLHVLCR